MISQFGIVLLKDRGPQWERDWVLAAVMKQIAPVQHFIAPKAPRAPVQQSGTKAPVGATLKFKVAGFRGVDRKQRFPVIAEGKISGFFWQFANPDEKQNSRDSFD